MTDEFEQAGDFALDPNTRKVRGLVVPYGKPSRLSISGIPPIKFNKGDITVPDDLTILGVNLEHDRFKPLARFDSLEHTDQGVVGVFSIGKTPDGDKVLADYARGVKMKLSPELAKIKRGPDGLSGTAVLTGAGFVTEGAWAESGLFAVGDNPDAGAPVVEPDPVPLATKTVLTPDAATGVLAVEADAVPLTVDVTVGSDTSKFIPDPSGVDMTDALAPAGGLFGAHGKNRRPAERQEPDEGLFAIRRVAEAMARKHQFGDGSALAALGPDPFGQEQGMFALSDIKFSTAGGVGVNLINPQFVGNLWNRRRYVRKFIPLWQHDDLHSFKITAWRPTTDPAMATWAGDKAAITSNAPATEPYSLTAKRFAGAHDIAREFRDFDSPEFWEWYFNAMTDSYAKLSWPQGKRLSALPERLRPTNCRAPRSVPRRSTRSRVAWTRHSSATR
jgi:hypothetical protein